MQNRLEKIPDCSIDVVMAIRDTIDFLSGKWKLPILGALMNGKKRFKDLEKSLDKITPKMLSKELKDLEINQMVKRKVYDTTPITIEYEITEYGRSLDLVLLEMYNWGKEHRRRIISKS